MRRLVLICLLSAMMLNSGCRRSQTDFVTIALPDAFSTLNTLTSVNSDAAAERVRNLIFNTLVKKDARFEYVGELADNISTAPDGVTVTFTLRNGVKFHNGKVLSAADIKYTFDELFKSGGYKANAFYDTIDNVKTPQIVAIETPDDRTVVIKVAKPPLVNQLLSNLVTIPIIPEGTVAEQNSKPVGSGPFKFVNFDTSQNIVELAGNAEYWDGPPTITKLRIKTVTDASSLQAELQTGGVDLAPAPSNMPPDAIKSMGTLPNLNVEQFDGSNIQYLGFNTQSAPLDNVKIRQAIGYAIDRPKIISELLSGQAIIAASVLPEASWAYSRGNTYEYNVEKAKQLIRESGYRGEPIKFKYAAGNAAFGQYAQAIQSSLNDIGLAVQIETLDPGTLRQQVAQGQFQINTGVWIGGNQDPIFLRDLFTTGKIPSDTVSCCNRSRYSNPRLDSILLRAVDEPDRAKAKDLYAEAWQIISEELPMLPLWYPKNIIIANKRIGNIRMSPSGDWSFVKDLTIQ